MHQMHCHWQQYSSISQLELSDSVVLSSLYENHIDIWTAKSQKMTLLDHGYIVNFVNIE